MSFGSVPVHHLPVVSILITFTREHHHTRGLLHILVFLYIAVGSNGLRTTKDKKDYSNSEIKRDTAATDRTPTDAEKAWSEKIADPS